MYTTNVHLVLKQMMQILENAYEKYAFGFEAKMIDNIYIYMRKVCFMFEREYYG